MCTQNIIIYSKMIFNSNTNQNIVNSTVINLKVPVIIIFINIVIYILMNSRIRIRTSARYLIWIRIRIRKHFFGSVTALQRYNTTKISDIRNLLNIIINPLLQERNVCMWILTKMLLCTFV